MRSAKYDMAFHAQNVCSDMDRPNRLTPRQQHCLARRDQHYTNKEIARELGVSPATVAMHLYIARQKLRANQCRRRDGPAQMADDSLRAADIEGAAREPVEVIWSDILAQAAAIAMLWLTILALLALLTRPLIDR